MTTSGRIRLKQAAALLGVHAETLRRWAKDGMVPYWAVGRGRYLEFDPKDVEALDHSFKRERPEPPVHYMGVDLGRDDVTLSIVVPSGQLDAVKEAAHKHGIDLKER